jgi:molecular chaperone GrpE
MTDENNHQEDNAEMNHDASAESEEPTEAILEATEVAAEDYDALKHELNEWQDKANEYLDGWQRARAEFANYKKRIERDQAIINQNAAANVIRRFLEITDDLELALKSRPAEGDGAGWAEGVELIYRKLSSLLESEGVSPIETEGQFFDPNLHEAITYEQHPGLESGQIIAVVKQGYRMGDRILRPAQVRVAS